MRMREAVGPEIGRLVVPGEWSRPPTGEYPWAADNGAYGGFEPAPFLRMLGALAGRPGCLFVSAPDEVADARLTLERFETWAPVIRDADLPVAFVLQDGFDHVGIPPWAVFDALFIGGSTAFKFSEPVRRIVAEARSLGRWVHCGRVNSTRRLRYAASIGCDSVDGTNWSRFTDTYLHQLAILKHDQGGLW